MPLTKDKTKSPLGGIENERVERTLSNDNTKKMTEAIFSFANDIRNTKKPGDFLIGADDDGKLDGQTLTDEQLRSYAGLRNSGTILTPPAILLGDYTTFKVSPTHGKSLNKIIKIIHMEDSLLSKELIEAFRNRLNI